LKGKNIVFSSPIVAHKVKRRRHFTRVVAKQNILVKDDTVEASSQQKGKYQYSKNLIEFFDITTPHLAYIISDESNPTFKRLKRQLKEERAKADKLKKEDLGSKKKIKELMGTYYETIDKERLSKVGKEKPRHDVQGCYQKKIQN